MSIPMSLLALLDEAPRYGFQLKQEFDARTGGVWPLNVGQVYTTLARLQRDGLVEAVGEDDPQRTYGITPAGRERLAAWFDQPEREPTPPRDELVLKLVLAAHRGRDRLAAVIQSERRAAVELLQEYTRLKRDPGGADDLGWLLLLDALIFKAEARVRWLDAAQERMARHAVPDPPPQATPDPLPQVALVPPPDDAPDPLPSPLETR